MTEQYQRVNINVPGVRQVSSADLTVDLATTAVDPIFAPLLTVPIITSGGPLEVSFSASVLSSAFVGVTFRVSVDGTPIFSRGSFGISPTIPASGSFDMVRPVVGGTHRVSVDWAKAAGSAGATVIAITPITTPALSGSSLVVKELFNG